MSRGINLKRVYPKVGRNDDCPCGSTWENGVKKKFKHCCIQGEWANDMIDVYYNLLKRGDKYVDLNEMPVTPKEIIDKEDERIL